MCSLQHNLFLSIPPSRFEKSIDKLFSQNLLIPKKESYKAAPGLGVSLKEGSFPRTRFRYKHKTAVTANVSTYAHCVHLTMYHWFRETTSETLTLTLFPG